MIDDLKPYRQFKDSGVPRLGKLPGHWDLRRLRHVTELRVSNVDKHTKKSEFPVRLCNYVNVYKNERIGEQLQFMRATATREELERFALNVNDVVITKDSEDWKDIGVPALIEYAAPDFVCGYHLAILRPRQEHLDGAFLLRAIQSRGVATQFHIGANGVTRYGLSHSDIKDTLIPIPPLNEQAAIVRFLDHANGKIERAIRAKRKLIALLNEQKQAIIHCAVTRGLDPAVKLKPSGIPWLGDVPEHWELRPLKQLLTRLDYGTSENSRGDGRIRVLGMGHIRDGRITLPAKGGLDVVPTGLLLQRHDLLFNRTNSPDLVGKVGLFEGVASDEVTFASYLVRLRLKVEFDPVWLNYLLNSFRFWGYARSQALVSLHQANLNSKRYGQMTIPVPPSSEQPLIVQGIRAQSGVPVATITRTEREIELLREYRTRLTADVVTGQLDVREAAARLPAEAEELPPADDLPDDEDAPEEFEP